MATSFPRASVIIPVRNAIETVCDAVESVLNSTDNVSVEVIIVNDDKDPNLALLARRYPVTVVEGEGRGPASARNIGVRRSQGGILLFLDADCRVSRRWLTSHFDAHDRYGSFLVVGGSIRLDGNASLWARCDHYCSWYHVHPDQGQAWVPNHPTLNLSVSRSTFERVGFFREDLPQTGVHEDIEWEERFLRLGGHILFVPRAEVQHEDRSRFREYLRHHYRWGYNSLEVKGRTAVSRFPWLYERPLALMMAALPFAVAHTVYIVWCWRKAGRWEPLLLSPLLASGCLAYASGMFVGGLKASLKKRQGKRVEDHAHQDS